MTPEDYKESVQKAFDDTPLGKVYTYRRTFTDGDVSIFCGITGDLNPHHLDDTFSAASRFQRRIIPGLLTASMATHLGGMVGFIATEMHFEYVAAVYVGDTITCTVTMVEKNLEKRIMKGQVLSINQEDRLVLRGYFLGFPTQLRLA